MRTNIEIDDQLMREAQEVAGTPTKKETVEVALRMLIRMKAQERIRDIDGPVEFWPGYNYKVLRETPGFDWDAPEHERPDPR